MAEIENVTGQDESMLLAHTLVHFSEGDEGLLEVLGSIPIDTQNLLELLRSSRYSLLRVALEDGEKLESLHNIGQLFLSYIPPGMLSVTRSDRRTFLRRDGNSLAEHTPNGSFRGGTFPQGVIYFVRQQIESLGEK